MNTMLVGLLVPFMGTVIGSAFVFLMKDALAGKMQKAMLDIKKKFGKNAVLRGMSLQEGATARERNGQIGGHKA